MTIIRKHWFLYTYIERNVFGKYRFYVLPSIVIETELGKYTFGLNFLHFGIAIGYNKFPIPENMWETNLFGL